jgi:Xaa-Pro aminopeptidase
MEDGDFLLMDYAPDVGYYEADVTRMFPVNGKFSQWQRELYGFYLACYREIIKAIAPARRASSASRRRRGDGGRPREVEVRQGVAPQGRPRTSSPSTRRAARASTRISGTGSGMATHDVGSHAGPAARREWCSRSSRR